MSHEPKNVLVINHYPNNKGDRAVLTFVVRELSRAGVSQIVVSASDPESWRCTLSDLASPVTMTPWGWGADHPKALSYGRRVMRGLKRHYFRRVAYRIVRSRIARPSGRLARALCNGRFYRAVRAADLIISTGGHHLTTLLTTDGVSNQLCDQAMAALSGTPLVLWSQSIGPFEFQDRRDLEAAKGILTRSAMVYVRDEQSIQLMQRHGVGQANVRGTFDSVVGLNDAIGEYVAPSARGNTVGVAIYSAQERSCSQKANYVDVMVALVLHVNAQGATVRFFPMELKGSISDDRALVAEIVSRCDKVGGQCTVEDRDLDTLTHLKEVSKCRLFVGHKTHSVVFGLTVGTPMLAIAYHRKTRDFMDKYGLSENCIDDSELATDLLLRKVANLQQNLDAVGRMQAETSRVLGAKVRDDFRGMLAYCAGSCTRRSV